jgi:hypothetical protein
MIAALAAASAVTVSTAQAQTFFNQQCRITGINFSFATGGNHRTVQTFSGDGCSTSFTGGLSASFESISVARRARHLTVLPTSNGFGFTVQRRTANYRGPDSYTLRICGQDGGRRGCVEITYDVTIN